MNEHTSKNEIAKVVGSFILDQFLPGEDPSVLNDDTRLITGGILDSIATIKLLGFLEERFGVEIAAHEASVDYMNTIPDLAALIADKLREKK